MAPRLASLSALAATAVAVESESVPFAFRVNDVKGVPFAFRIQANGGKKTMLQTYNAELDGTDDKTHTPITRVVNLLNDMKKTLQTEADEDEDMYDKLACWCNDNTYGKNNAIATSEETITELEHSIEALTAKSSELTTKIKETEAQVAEDKQALAEATAQREKEVAAFHGEEMDEIQAIENMKSAIEVLGRHAASASFLAEVKEQVSFLSTGGKGKKNPWESKRLEHSLDEFMRTSDFDNYDAPDVDVPTATPGHKDGFLQHQDTAAEAVADTATKLAGDVAVVRRAMHDASAFTQTHHMSQYYPAYQSQSGNILGVLEQMKEEMESGLSEGQKTEMMRASAFAELRSAKTSEIENGEKMAEQKEDELAKCDNDNAESKEDLAAEMNALSASQKFLINLKSTCGDADKNFQIRKAARLEEITAVSETIEILMDDKARDAMSGTYNFLQLSSHAKVDKRRNAAASLLRKAAAKTANPELVALATTVELDSFTKVKKAIDDMVGMLKTQQADEVKKNDWCAASLSENEMQMMKGETARDDLTAKIGVLDQSVAQLNQGILDAQASIADLQTNQQRASEDRKIANTDFQSTVADQTMTIEVLHKALDKLATFYDKEFLQTKKGVSLIQRGSKQTPPVPQAEYKPNSGSSGVMSMIEKLIHDAKGLVADSKTSEMEAQAAYEALVADTNTNVAALTNEVVNKTKAKAKAQKDKLVAESDLMDTVDELEGIHNTGSDLHAECDYVTKNFDTRQEARGQEIEALQQAKQILSGAGLN